MRETAHGRASTFPGADLLKLAASWAQVRRWTLAGMTVIGIADVRYPVEGKVALKGSTARRPSLPCYVSPSRDSIPEFELLSPVPSERRCCPEDDIHIPSLASRNRNRSTVTSGSSTFSIYTDGYSPNSPTDLPTCSGNAAVWAMQELSDAINPSGATRLIYATLTLPSYPSSIFAAPAIDTLRAKYS